jgi:thiol-disulfide isomerase/thioredoxin
MLKNISLVFLAALLMVSGCSTGYSTQLPKSAPDFQLKTLDGQVVTLSQFRGKPVLLNFWASWCQPCRDEMPYLQQTYNNYKDKGLVFYAVDIGESPEAINKYFLDNSLLLPVLLDSDKTVGQSYQITGVPETFLIDENGIIRKWQIGAYPNAQAIADDLKIIIQ